VAAAARDSHVAALTSASPAGTVSAMKIACFARFMTLFALVLPAVLASSVNRSRADDGGPTFTFGAATSFVFDINQPDHEITDENPKTYADGESEESFNIDLVQIGASGTRGRVSYGAKFDFGDWADAVANDLEDEIALQEMYLAVDAGFALVSAGRMPTPLGYEVLEPWANANISRSRAWFYQAVSHDGAAIAGEIGSVSLMVAIVNGFHVNGGDLNNPDDEYGVIASMGVPFGSASFRLTGMYSDEEDAVRKYEINGNVGGTVERWRYGVDGTWYHGEGHVEGSADPPRPKPLDSDVWDVTAYGGATFGHWSGDARLSYTDQEGTNNNLFHRNHENVVSFTATGGYEIVEGVVLRAEYRVDSADDDIFDDDNSGLDDGNPSGLSDLVQVVQVQLLWTPATGQH
jgi:hypothetical protein